MSTRREWALKVLGLDSSATETDMRTAYRDLVAVWHPDRYVGNERLRQRAEAMMKRLNTARDILRGVDPGTSWVDDSGEWEDLPPEPPPPPEPPAPSPAEPVANPTHTRKRQSGGFVKLLAWCGAIALSAYLLSAAFQPRTPASEQTPITKPDPVVSAGVAEAKDLPPGQSAVAEGTEPEAGRKVLGKLGQAVKATPIMAAPGGRVYYRVKPYEYLVLRTSDLPDHYRVLLQNGKEGYVAADSVAKLPYDVTAPKITKAAIKKAVLAQIGQTGPGLANGGFVEKVWEELGLEKLGSIAEHSELGKPVARLEDLAVGDRLYFWSEKKERIVDAGIYLGNGYMAWYNPALRRVTVDYLGTAAMLKRLTSAKRSLTD